LKCHAPLGEALKKKAVHAAVEMGCESCHIDHQKPGENAGKKPSYLNAAQPELCQSCHDLKDEKISKAHHGQPAGKSECTGCHNPHSSDAPKLMQANVHPAFGADTCDSCHKPPEGGQIRLVTSGANELCYQCHAEQKERFEGAKSKHSLLAADASSCVSCHNPHAAAQPRLLKKAQPELCNDCHSVVADKKFIHQPAQAGCTLCHNPHASDSPKNLHAAVNAVCMECHSSGSAGVVKADVPLRLFGGKVTLAASPFRMVQLLALKPDAAFGHPMPSHPISKSAEKDKAELNCVTCHNPHGGNGSTKRFQTETASSSPLCGKCHQ
jgi:predicted CXXCH cytochrome family protein